MKCSRCPYEADEFQFAFTDTRKMDEPLCMTCFTKEVEGRIKKVEQTLHTKSCIICKYKGLAKDFASLPVAPTKLVCKSCVDALHLVVVKEKVDAELRKV